MQLTSTQKYKCKQWLVKYNELRTFVIIFCTIVNCTKNSLKSLKYNGDEKMHFRHKIINTRRESLQLEMHFFISRQY